MARKKKEGIKEAIIENAILMLGTKSYADIRVEDIAKNTGIAKGSVYQHFKSKEEIFASVIEYFYSVLNEEFYNITQSNLKTADKMNNIIGIVSGYLNESLASSWIGIIDLLVNNKKTYSDLLVNQHSQITATLAYIISQGQQEDIYRTDIPPETLASTVWAIIDGYFIKSLIYNQYEDIQTIINQLIIK